MSVSSPIVVAYANAVTGQDSDGNDVLTSTPVPTAVMAVWPTDSTERVSGGDSAVTGETVLFSGLPDLSFIDVVTIDGVEYDVDGEPGFFTHPRAGVKVTEVKLKKVAG